MSKKSKKGKKSKRKVIVRKTKILLFLLAVIAIIIFILKATNVKFGLTASMKVIDKYMSCLNEEKYDEMYDMISESSKKAISKEDFISRNEEIYGQIEARSITVSDMKEEVQDNR